MENEDGRGETTPQGGKVSLLALLVEKLLFPLGLRVLGDYVRRSLLTPRQVFNKRGRELASAETRALAMVKAVGLRFTSSRVATQRALNQITIDLAEYLGRDPDAGTRKFGINFLSYYTDDMTIGELMTTLKRLDPRSLAAIVSAVVTELQGDPAVRLISVRDVLSNVLQSTEDQCRAEFETGHLLQRYLEHRVDHQKYESPNGREVQIEYGGIDPPLTPDSDVFKEMRRAQEDMKFVGHRTSRQKCSRTHIVMSVAVGPEWEGCAGAEKSKFAVMSAEKTDKTNLLVPSQTPVVTKVGAKWLYYGDPTARPTSELASHWAMHEKLCSGPLEWRQNRAIFHAHMVELIALSRKYLEKTTIPLGGRQVPNIDWIDHGTVQLGERVVVEMMSCKSQMAIVKHHGPWFVCRQLGDGLDMALDVIRQVSVL